MKKIVFAGTFDPLTNGHLWVIEEGLQIADEVVVFVAENVNKKTYFSASVRKKMIEDSCNLKGFGSKVSVMVIKNEYVATKALQIGATHLIRGIRSSNDFDYEALIQKTNTDVLDGAKTVFVMPPRDLESVSSSFVKSLMGPVGWHWHVKQFLPQPVYEKVLEYFIEKVARENIQHPSLPNFLDVVFQNYKDSNRHYHNLEHIAHCLQEMIWFKNNSNEVVNYEQMCVAILAHDIIYGSKEQCSDEVLSAELMVKILGDVNFVEAKNMILATQHFADLKNFSNEEKIMRSIDLAILAQPAKIYDVYKQNIRQEYAYVDDDSYLKGRISALHKLLSQDKLFESPIFGHYEDTARHNLKNELINLENIRNLNVKS